MNDTDVVIVLGSGSVEYALEEAVIPIQELIDLLESAKDEGATHVVESSGNYRGASWARISTNWSWADDE